MPAENSPDLQDSRLEDATATIRDGLDLLDCVESIDTTNIEGGKLLVSAYLEDSTGIDTFEVNVTLVNGPSNVTLADQHGGVWGEHPEWTVAEWQIDVEACNTRSGYWDWVVSSIEANAD